MEFDPKKLKIIRPKSESGEWYDIEESGSFRPAVYNKELYLGEVFKAPYEDVWQIDLRTNSDCCGEFASLRSAKEWLSDYLEDWLRNMSEEKYQGWCDHNSAQLEDI